MMIFSSILFSLLISLGSISAVCSNDKRDELERIFTHVYERKIWGEDFDKKGCSGSGSTFEASQEYVQFVKKFIEENHIRSVLDIGCGDGAITGFLKLDNNISYIGIDVVEDLIERNKAKYPCHNFFKLNAVIDPLPEVDLILCKDVLQHLSLRHIKGLIENVKKSAKYFIFTNDDLQSKVINSDIKSGPFHRTVDLTKPPFSFKTLARKTYKCPTGEIKVILLIENDQL